MTKPFSITKYRYQMERMSEIKTQILDELLDEIPAVGCYVSATSDVLTISKNLAFGSEEIILSYEKDAVGYKSIRTSFTTAKKRVQLFLDKLCLEQL